MEKKYKKLWICLAGGIAVFIVGMIVLAVVLLKDNGDDTDSDRKKKDNDVVVTGEALNPEKVKAGEGCFAAILKSISEDAPYTYSVSYQYQDEASGKTASFSQIAEHTGDYWYIQNKCVLLPEEKTALEKTYLYDKKTGDVYVVDEKIAVACDDSIKESVTGFLSTYTAKLSDNSMTFVRSETAERDGKTYTVEIYRIANENGLAAKNDSESRTATSSEKAATQNILEKDTEVTPDSQDLIQVFFDEDGEPERLKIGDVEFVIAIASGSPSYVTEALLEECVRYAKKESFTWSEEADQVASNVNAEALFAKPTFEDEEIIHRFKEAQFIYREYYCLGNRYSEDLDAMVRKAFTPEVVEKLSSTLWYELQIEEMETYHADTDYSSGFQEKALYAIRKNNENDYSIFFSVRTKRDEYWGGVIVVKEIHYLYDGNDWHFDGYLPSAITEYAPAEKDTLVYRIANPYTYEDMVTADDSKPFAASAGMIDDGTARYYFGHYIQIKDNRVSYQYSYHDGEEEGDKYNVYFGELTCGIASSVKQADGSYTILLDGQWEYIPQKDWVDTYEAGGYRDTTYYISKEITPPPITELIMYLPESQRGKLDQLIEDTLIDNPFCDMHYGMIPLGVENDYTWEKGVFVQDEVYHTVSDNPYSVVLCAMNDKTPWGFFGYTCENYGNYEGDISYDKQIRTTIEYGGGSTDVVFSSGLFDHDPKVYNTWLSVLGCALSSAAYGEGGNSIYTAYQKLGFPSEKISLFSYPGHNNNEQNVPGVISTDTDQAFSIASRKMDSDRILVVLTMRGTMSWDDLLKDVNASTVKWLGKDTHIGFLQFAKDVLNGWTYYRNKHPELEEALSNGKVDFLVTGHSLGAACANIVAVTFQNMITNPGNKVFGYCYATPRTFHTFLWEGPEYENIWNMIIEQDRVPAVPLDVSLLLGLQKWTRYGQEKRFDMPLRDVTEIIKGAHNTLDMAISLAKEAHSTLFYMKYIKQELIYGPNEYWAGTMWDDFIDLLNEKKLNQGSYSSYYDAKITAIADYDNDGEEEAFLIKGNYIGFASKNGVEYVGEGYGVSTPHESLREEYSTYYKFPGSYKESDWGGSNGKHTYFYYPGQYYVVDIGERKLFVYETEEMRGNVTYIYGVKDGKWYFVNRVRGSISLGKDGSIHALEYQEDAVSDMDCADTGQMETGVLYYLYWNGEHMYEYGGIEISKADLLRCEGAEEILSSLDGKEIKEILYRGNGIININYKEEAYYQGDEWGGIPSQWYHKNFNLTVQLEDGKVHVVSQNPSRGFSYKSGTDIGKEYVTYPESFPIK